MEKGDDPYEILGVPYEASEAEVKKAYRKAALKFHPDKQQTDEDKERAHDIFAKLSAAYDVLTDPVKRYDWKQANEQKLKRGTSTASTTSSSSVTSTSNHAPSSQRKPGGSPPPVKRPGQGPPPPPGSGQQGRGRGSGRGPPPPPGAACRGTPRTPGGSKKQPPQPPPVKRPGSSTGRGPPPPPGASRSTPGTPGGRKKRVSAPVINTSNHSQQSSPAPISPKRHSVASSTPTRNPNSPKRTSSSTPSRSSSNRPPPMKRGQYRDPFDIFDEVMKEEYGEDYKESDLWKESKGISGLAKMVNPFGKKKESSKKEFKKLDVNKDKTLSKSELRKYIENKQELWTVLGMRLNLTIKKCMEIATDVAFQLATGRGERKPLNNQYSKDSDQEGQRELTEEEFTHFHKMYVLDDKGAHEFFLRTIFSAFDANGDGVLQKKELDNFLDVFYEAGNVFEGKMKLPPKKELRRVVFLRLDKNRDGVLNFHEIRDLLEVAAVVTSSSEGG